MIGITIETMAEAGTTIAVAATMAAAAMTAGRGGKGRSTCAAEAEARNSPIRGGARQGRGTFIEWHAAWVPRGRMSDRARAAPRTMHQITR
mmetsp:Transcript_22065/g.61822  ORF Transcript_22065/g.61822 Transcript_22065/m.61822 type:complete len:91 (-) Transcript_22065:54-326(-)